MGRFDNKEKELEVMSKGELIYCEKGDTCNIKHCHLCNKPSDSPCCCSDCVGIARDNWLHHYHNHLMNKVIEPSCKFCSIPKEKDC